MDELLQDIEIIISEEKDKAVSQEAWDALDKVESEIRKMFHR